MSGDAPWHVSAPPPVVREAIGFPDTPLGGHIIGQPDDVSALRYVFDELRSHSLPVAATLDRVTAVREAHQ